MRNRYGLFNSRINIAQNLALTRNALLAIIPFGSGQNLRRLLDEYHRNPRASFVPPGSIGHIVAGNAERGSMFILGSYQVLGGTVEEPRGEIATLQATRLSWPSEDGRQYQVQVSPDLQTWENTGPMMDGTGGDLEFLAVHSTQRQFYPASSQHTAWRFSRTCALEMRAFQSS